MKFLCPSCKAKYQIADEKVTGRSVRMKCRKCGYLINISKAVTEGSASLKLSSMPPPGPEPGEPAEPPSAPAGGWREPGARTSQPGPPPRPPPRRPGPAPVAPPRAAAAAAPGVGTASAPRPAPAPAAPKTGNGSSQHHAFRVEAPPVHRDDDERTVIAGVGALSHAFTETVARPGSSAIADALATGDDWYVGINGVPVGPIRLSEMRSKAAAGAISTESLVWREGFEQWLPLSNFPELVAVVEEGSSSARAAVAPLAAPPAVSAPAPDAPRPDSPEAVALPGGTPAVAQDPFQELLRPSRPVPGELAASPLGQAPATSAVGLVAAPAGLRPAVESEDVVLAPPRGGPSVFAWVAVGVAMMLGLTIGFVVFSKKPPEPVVKYVEVPAKAGETPAAPSAGVGTEAIGEVSVEADAGGGKPTRPAGGVAGSTKTGDNKTEEKPLTGLAGLQGLQGSGPTAGPGTTNAGAGTGGQPLDSGEIQKTVGKYTSGVKRSCWQPALDARSKDAPTSARVNVAIVVGPSGNVQSVSTSGDPKGYPGLASCIAARVKAWQFPASSGTTTVNVPFVFASQ